MLLSELYAKLSFGELSNLALSGEGSGQILEPSRPRILHLVNDGLLKLYTRFRLKDAQLTLQQYEHITFYHLVPRFAVNFVPANPSQDEPIRYILDQPGERFAGDVIRVLGAYSNDLGERVLNDLDHPDSLFTPQPNVLQIPLPQHEQPMSVLYQAHHPILQGEMDEEVLLPSVLTDALTGYIAWKVYGQLNTPDGVAKAQEYQLQFNTVCSDVEGGDLVSTSSVSTNTRFQARGWV